jgi:RNA polymerase sigma-70 factor (ECF subfamily)
MRCVPAILRVENARLGRGLRPDELEDLVQDTLVAVWRKIDRYMGEAKLETWVWEFCALELRSALRRQGRRARLLDEQNLVPPERCAGVETPSIDYEDVYESLDRLPEEERVVVRLKHFSHLTFEQTAQRLGLSPNTVKTRYYRALLRLRRWLAPRKEVERV